MTTINGAREAIYSRWDTQWGVTTPFTFGNEKFTSPVDSPWARLTVLHESGEDPTLGSLGNRKFTRRGRVLVQLYDVVNGGLRSLDLLADQARDIFEGTQFSGLRFVNVDIRESGQDGEWYQLVVDAPFDYQEIK